MAEISGPGSGFGQGGSAGTEWPSPSFYFAYQGDLSELAKLVEIGFPIDAVDPETGMSILHIAVGRNNLDMVKYLVERGASFFADATGRWPTTVAAVCEVSEELSDFIAEAEARAESV